MQGFTHRTVIFSGCYSKKKNCTLAWYDPRVNMRPCALWIPVNPVLPNPKNVVAEFTRVIIVLSHGKVSSPSCGRRCGRAVYGRRSARSGLCECSAFCSTASRTSQEHSPCAFCKVCVGMQKGKKLAVTSHRQMDEPMVRGGKVRSLQRPMTTVFQDCRWLLHMKVADSQGVSFKGIFFPFTSGRS